MRRVCRLQVDFEQKIVTKKAGIAVDRTRQW
jgi:hypothetical protein